MVIRQQQIEQMQEARWCNYVEALARHLEANFRTQIAAHDLDHGRLRFAVHQAIDDAAQYGVYTADDAMLYVECIAILSPKFDTNPEYPWAGEILRRTDISGASKMEAINEMLLFGLGGPR